ncbi:MAG: hypothetical protein ACE5K4_13010, partial [Candidatus Hydrothermarchaeota archaeon]
MFRPDAAVAFDDRGVKKALGRYINVVEGVKTASFLISKAIPVSIPLDSEEKNLWKEHDLKLTEMRKLRKSINSKGRKPKPRATSLLHLKKELARRMLSSCRMCERRCLVNRAAGKR